MRVFRCVTVAVLLTAALPALAGNTYYVSTTGDDDNAGTIGAPWRTIKDSVPRLHAGDTLVIRGGLYRESYIDDFNSGAAGNPITVRGYPGENVVVNGGQDLSDEDLWEHVGGDVYRYADAIPTTYRNVSENGIPYRLMVRYDNFEGWSHVIDGPGQWSRNRYGLMLWVRSRDGGNPGRYNIEVSNAARVICIPPGADHVVIENLTVENGYYAIYIEGDDAVIRNCTMRNVYGDGLKGGKFTQRGLVENCDIYHFGESAIDITGGDYWTLRNTSAHHCVRSRYPTTCDGWKTNGFMLKNDNHGAIVEGCRLFDMPLAVTGAIAIGGTSSYTGPPSATGLVVRNNVMHDIYGPFVVAFQAAHDSMFHNNLIYDCDVTATGVPSPCGALLLVRNARNTITWDWIWSSDNRAFNNVFVHNTATYNYSEFIDGNDDGMRIDNNIVDTSRPSFFDDRSMTHQYMIALKGYDEHSPTAPPTFADEAHRLLRPAPDSPAIDAGRDLRGVVDDDHNGFARFDGRGFEIGPFENRHALTVCDGGDAAAWSAPPSGSATSVFDPDLQSAAIELGGERSTGYSRPFDWGDAGFARLPVVAWTARVDGPRRFTVKLRFSAGGTRSIHYCTWLTSGIETPGDFSGDGAVNGLDIPPFKEALSDPDGWAARTRRDPHAVGDFNGDGVFNGLDIPRFKSALEGDIYLPLDTDDPPDDGQWRRYAVDLRETFIGAANAESVVFECGGGTAIDELGLHGSIAGARWIEGCVGRWPMNEAADDWTEDTSGLGRHGRLTNMPLTDPRDYAWVIGRTTKAIRFGEGHTYVEAPGREIDVDEGFTLTLWVRPANASDTGRILAAGITGSGLLGSTLTQEGDRLKLTFTVDGGTVVEASTVAGALESGRWHRVAAVVNRPGGEVRLYVNGLDRTEGGPVAFEASAIDTGSAPLRFGAGESIESTFRGAIDEASLYRRPLPPWQTTDETVRR